MELPGGYRLVQIAKALTWPVDQWRIVDSNGKDVGRISRVTMLAILNAHGFALTEKAETAAETPMPKWQVHFNATTTGGREPVTIRGRRLMTFLESVDIEDDDGDDIARFQAAAVDYVIRLDEEPED